MARASQSKKRASKQPGPKLKITLSMSRSALAALDRVRAKRLERGGGRREVQNSALVEEAIELLRQKEGI